MSQDTIDIIRLVRSSGIGSVRYKKLLLEFGSAKKAILFLQENPSFIGKNFRLCPLEEAEKEYQNGQLSGAISLAFDSPYYPKTLSETYHAPPLLWAKGNLDLLSKISVAIVGSRNASVGGRKIAYSCAKELGASGYITISGLARGIDRAAHEGSLDTGTIAVIAGGVDQVYPPEHKELYHDILKKEGLILSENPPFSKPKATLFPRRNRIISGISTTTLIVEATLKSGSLTTADFALEQYKELFAVPGSPLDPRSLGPNKLLQNGANWALSSKDILSYLDAIPQTISIEKKEKLGETIRLALKAPRDVKEQKVTEDSLLKLFSHIPISADEVIRLSHKPSGDILPLLAEHELFGNIKRLPGNMFIKNDE